jgi:putative Holliday junction resolvase
MSITSVLGFDYGLKRIGVATGQTITSTATPLTTIKQSADGSHWQEISAVVAKWKPDALIVGIPYMLDGSETEMSQHTRDFKQQLEQHYQLPTFLVDETLSSYQAEATLRQNMKIGQHNKAEIDKMAAAIIVQSWLDQQ